MAVWMDGYQKDNIKSYVKAPGDSFYCISHHFKGKNTHLAKPSSYT